MTSGFLITVCEQIKKPLFSEVQIIGLGKFSSLTEKIGESTESEFIKRGYITSRVGYNAMTSPEGKVLYCKGNKDERSESHEEFHVLMKKAKLKSKDFKDPAKNYLSMFNESAATAVEEYCLNQSENSDVIKKSTELKREFGRRTYDFVGRCLTLDAITENEVTDFASKSFANHKPKNWASMLVDLTYFGFLDSCYGIMENHGLQKGQEELINLAVTLRDDSTAKTFFEGLKQKSGKDIKPIPPIKEGIVYKGLFEYRADGDNYLKMTFSGPLRDEKEDRCGFFIDIKKLLMQKYGDELNSLGEVWMNAWANEIIFGGFE